MDALALGRYLREAREAKELTLDDAERTLRIRQRVLEAFELGDFRVMDASPVQIRGFIGNYARQPLPTLRRAASLTRTPSCRRSR